jgi:hypothetical protein
MWYDLTVTDIVEAQVSRKEQCETGVRMFLVAHFFLWVYPKNSSLLASRFRICKCYSREEPLWKWSWPIAALKMKKIVWDHLLNNLNAELLVVTIDGTDFPMWEKKHPILPRDNGKCSKRFNLGAVKNEIAISTSPPRLCRSAAPFEEGNIKMTMLCQGGLLDKIADGKLGAIDWGYKSSRPEVEGKLSISNAHDSKELNYFISGS